MICKGTFVFASLYFNHRTRKLVVDATSSFGGTSGHLDTQNIQINGNILTIPLLHTTKPPIIVCSTKASHLSLSCHTTQTSLVLHLFENGRPVNWNVSFGFTVFGVAE